MRHAKSRCRSACPDSRDPDESGLALGPDRSGFINLSRCIGIGAIGNRTYREVNLRLKLDVEEIDVHTTIGA